MLIQTPRGPVVCELNELIRVYLRDAGLIELSRAYPELTPVLEELQGWRANAGDNL